MLKKIMGWFDQTKNTNGEKIRKMRVTKIDDSISVGGQITVDHVRQLADAGFRGIICNRPDNEDFIMTGFAEIEKAAEEAGMGVRYVPISHGQLSMGDIEDYAAARAEIEGPHFGYCQAGIRAATIWGLAEAKTGGDVNEILNKAANAGIRLDHMAGVLNQLAASAA